MKVINLSSGSKGNTTYVETDEVKLLIDAGNNCKYIISKLEQINVNPNDIDIILITHTHSDHIKGLSVLLKKIRPIIYITKPMLRDMDYLINYKIIENDETYYINDLQIDVIKTSHDAPGSVGYVLTSNDKSLVYITDTGYINKKYYELLSNRDMYIFESNHDIELLNNSRYPFNIRQRILSDKGHLSNYDASKYLANFIGSKTKYIYLAHLSEENNRPEIALNTLKNRLNEENIEFDNIYLAKQDIETELVII